jgi:hypothetical protein
MLIRPEDGNSSNIKFGGWDQSALQPGAEMSWFRSYNIKGWDLKSNEAMIGGKPFVMG